MESREIDLKTRGWLNARSKAQYLGVLQREIDILSRYHIVFVLLAVFFVCGCATNLPPARVEETTEYRFKKNYRIGESMSVNVGEPLVVIQDFWFTTQQGSVAIPNADIDVRLTGYYGAGGNTIWVFKRGSRYEIKGEKEIDGSKYAVVATHELIPSGSNSRETKRFQDTWVGLLVKADGTINASQVSYYSQNNYISPASISAPSVSFEREKNYRVLEARGYENYEIIYTGVNASGLNLTYREFSPEGLAKVAFFQNLSYESGVKNISFKKFKLSIESANSERIVFKVIEDGLATPASGR